MLFLKKSLLLSSMCAIAAHGVPSFHDEDGVPIHQNFLTALQARVLTIDVLGGMLTTPVAIEEIVIIPRRYTERNQRTGANEVKYTGDTITGKQRKLIHEECLAKWRPILKDLVDKESFFLRSIGVKNARTYIFDNSNLVYESLKSRLEINSASLFQLMIVIDDKDNCDGPTAGELSASMSKWRENPSIKAAVKATSVTLKALQKLSDPSKEFTDGLDQFVR